MAAKGGRTSAFSKAEIRTPKQKKTGQGNSLSNAEDGQAHCSTAYKAKSNGTPNMVATQCVDAIVHATVGQNIAASSVVVDTDEAAAQPPVTDGQSIAASSDAAAVQPLIAGGQNIATSVGQNMATRPCGQNLALVKVEQGQLHLLKISR